MGASRPTGAGLVSVGAAVLAFVGLGALGLALYRGIEERLRLESRNDAERTMSLLFASLRDHEDFGSAIESSASLKEKVVGVGVYAEGGGKLYSWGEAPETFTWSGPLGKGAEDPVRGYIDKPRNDSVILPLKPFRGPPPPPPSDGEGGVQASDRGHRTFSSFLSTTMRRAEIIYLEIREPAYWRGRRLGAVLFPLAELALAALVAFVRSLIVRNAGYRRRIEEQKNLVVLGTAASTLAHEIKNPLLSIRLQTRILEKTMPAGAKREIGIINDEVERLSALSHRVGDYLRDPAGQPEELDPAEIAAEVGARLCGRNILAPTEGRPPRVRMDGERLRSVLENLVRNALEAGGREEDVSMELGVLEGKAVLDVLDRGAGLAGGADERIFDPFFTTKSRGTGIGLAVCRRFVEAAGGSIALENRQGGGCRARVRLPAAREGP
jgi:two-component system sensor histidine kinase HydH